VAEKNIWKIKTRLEVTISNLVTEEFPAVIKLCGVTAVIWQFAL
jgi:hypothetical protein